MKSQVSRKQNEQNRRELIEKCKSSGKCQREWCTENNVSEKAFYYWRRKLAKETDIPNLYIICDTTDMRKGLKGLLEIVTAKYKLDPYSDSLFLFYRTAEGNKDHKCKIRPVLKFSTIKC